MVGSSAVGWTIEARLSRSTWPPWATMVTFQSTKQCEFGNCSSSNVSFFILFMRVHIRAINKIWRQTTAIANQASLTWHIVVTKLGSYSPGELADWVSVSLPTTSNMRALSVTEPQRTGSTGADGKRTGAFTSFATVTWMSIQVHEGLQLIDSRLLTDRQLAPSQASSIESSVPVPSATPPPPSAMPVVPVLPPLPSLSPAPLSFSQTSFNKSNRQLVLLHRVTISCNLIT